MNLDYYYKNLVYGKQPERLHVFRTLCEVRGTDDSRVYWWTPDTGNIAARCLSDDWLTTRVQVAYSPTPFTTLDYDYLSGVIEAVHGKPLNGYYRWQQSLLIVEGITFKIDWTTRNNSVVCQAFSQWHILFSEVYPFEHYGEHVVTSLRDVRQKVEKLMSFEKELGIEAPRT